MSSDAFIRVGWLGRSRGVHGDIWVTPDTDFPERFVDLKEIFVRSRSTWEKYTIVRSTLIGGRPVLRFEHIASPEEASRLTNRELAVSRDQVVELPEGSHYIFELIGCAVVDSASGEAIGELVNVEIYPANDVYLVETADGRMLSCPVVRSFVKQVDIAARRIVIDPRGLLDATSSK